MEITQNIALARLRSGNLALGFGVYHLRGPATAVIAESCGYHWLSIDAEHGAFSASEIGDLCIASLSSGITPIVRVSRSAIDMGRRALDNGAQGVIVPMVNSAAQAEELVSVLRYPPTGGRGWGGGGAAYRFRPPPIGDAIAEAERQNLIIAMIETAEGVENAHAIASVSGIDMIFVGALDLSVALGCPGVFDGERFRNAFDRVAEATRSAGKFLGMGGVYDEVVAPDMIAKGARFVAGGSDQGFLMASASQRAEQIVRLAPRG